VEVAQVEARVAGQAVQHVIEEPDAGRHVGAAGPIQVQAEIDRRLAGLAADLCCAVRRHARGGMRVVGVTR
jgi:hypothetical protein